MLGVKLRWLLHRSRHQRLSANDAPSLRSEHKFGNGRINPDAEAHHPRHADLTSSLSSSLHLRSGLLSQRVSPLYDLTFRLECCHQLQYSAHKDARRPPQHPSSGQLAQHTCTVSLGLRTNCTLSLGHFRTRRILFLGTDSIYCQLCASPGQILDCSPAWAMHSR